MPQSTTIARGNVQMEVLLQITVTPPATLAASTTTESTYSVPGVMVGDFIEINKPSHTTGLSIGNVRVASNNNIAIQWVNSTTSTITNAPNEQYLIVVSRFDSMPQTPPSAIA
jgi:hypothetical protein